MKLKDLLKRPEVTPTEIEGLYFRERSFGDLMESYREAGVESEEELDDVGKAHLNLSSYACDEKGRRIKDFSTRESLQELGAENVLALLQEVVAVLAKKKDATEKTGARKS